MKDLGKLRCTGETYSSFQNNVLQVKGKGIVSAQYSKIERMPGNDFDVVLSNPVSVQNTQKGESFSGDFGWVTLIETLSILNFELPMVELI